MPAAPLVFDVSVHVRHLSSFLALLLAVACACGAIASVTVVSFSQFPDAGRSFKFIPELVRAFGEPVARAVLFVLFCSFAALFFKMWRVTKAGPRSKPPRKEVGSAS